MNEQYLTVSIGRQLGSGGHTIGEHVAQRLHLKFFDRELIAHAAEKSGYSQELFEKSDEEKSPLHSFFTNLIPFYGNTDFYGNQVDEESLFYILSQTIREIAASCNCLIVGRCAEYILRNNAHLASIFISADLDDRIEHISQLRHISHDEAQKLIINNDKRRATFHDFYSNNSWGHAATYDLCVNSSKLGWERTEDLITDYLQQRFPNFLTITQRP